jgi:hypothetical protein
MMFCTDRVSALHQKQTALMFIIQPLIYSPHPWEEQAAFCPAPNEEERADDFESVFQLCHSLTVTLGKSLL